MLLGIYPSGPSPALVEKFIAKNREELGWTTAQLFEITGPGQPAVKVPGHFHY